MGAASAYTATRHSDGMQAATFRSVNARLASLLLVFASVVGCAGTDAPDDFVYRPPAKYEKTPAATVPPASTDTAPLPPTDPTPKAEVAPGITAIAPSAVTLGAATDTDITINGTGFIAGATVKLGTALLSATAKSATELTVHVGAERLRDAGDRALSVVNPSGMASNELTFTIATPSSVSIKTINPASVTAMGGSTVTIDIAGTGFIPSSVARFNGADVETSFVSATSISAIVPSNALQTAGKFSLTVSNGASVVSLPASLDVLNPTPTITALNPPAIRQAAATITLEIQGKNFTTASTVYANGTAQSSAYVTVVSSTRIQMQVNAASTIGNYKIQVATPAPGGGASAGANFQIGY